MLRMLRMVSVLDLLVANSSMLVVTCVACAFILCSLQLKTQL